VTAPFEEQWREQMILTFPDRPAVREIAAKELLVRDGKIGAVAKSYAANEEVMHALLRVLAPLPEHSRLVVVSALKEAAVADGNAIQLLDECGEDTDSSVASEGIFGWIESLVARESVSPEHVRKLAQALHTLGPDFEERRIAAVIALAMAGRLDLFAEATDRSGDPLKVRVTTSYRGNDGRYIRRIMRLWPQFIETLGSTDAVVDRLGMAPETVLPMLNPNEPNTAHLFDVLMRKAKENQHLAKYDEINALARFAPMSKELRKLILDQFTGERAEYWGALVAGEVFAEQFAQDAELVEHMIGEFSRFPGGLAAAALAEYILRHPDPRIESLLKEKTAQISYDAASHFKLVAALSTSQKVVQALTQLLNNIPISTHDLHFQRWVQVFQKTMPRPCTGIENRRSREVFKLNLI
jgi:hypothetical protein